jgi:hypothetical protein
LDPSEEYHLANYKLIRSEEVIGMKRERGQDEGVVEDEHK